jgi:hypothetical protein
MGKPIDHLAHPGDLVSLDLFVFDESTPPAGLVLALDNGWAHVQWHDNTPQVDQFDKPVWSQWYPRKELTIISSACEKSS